MSMIGTFRALPDEELQALFADPTRVEQLLYTSLVGGSNGKGDEMDVDKAWHGLHFLLTDTAWEGDFPLNFIAAGGQEVGDDLGYGPARGLTSSDVQQITAALDPLTSEELRPRFDSRRMTELEIYPFGWSHDPDGELEYLLDFYAELRAFVRRTAEQSRALLVYLT
jgi:hypothetical protein